jgi:arylsulfatase A-like enzyme
LTILPDWFETRQIEMTTVSRIVRVLTVASTTMLLFTPGQADERPDIVWIVIEDMSAHWRCYGETLVETPNLDQLAREGVRFDRAYVTAPVCSTGRSALITGMYQTTIGAHHHRSGRGDLKITLPNGIRPLPELFNQAGYASLNQQYDPFRGGKPRAGKTDYNFEWDESIYSGFDPNEFESDRPLFIQYQLSGGKIRGKTPGWTEEYRERFETILPRIVEPDEVTLPPYYPDHPDILADWAAYLNVCMVTDWEVGQIVDQLKVSGRWENTVLFVFTDHGISHARGKQFCYEEGMRIPLIVTGPGLPRDQTRRDLVEHIDIAASSLVQAGIELPDWMQGRNLFSSDYEPREYAVCGRDRCDETIDHIRGVVTDDFKYIRNYLPRRPHLQPSAYKDSKFFMKALWSWHAEGKLSPLQDHLLFAPERPMEELYNLRSDPWETRNLASDPAYGFELAAMRNRLTDWEQRTGDQGRSPETRAMYDSDFEARLKPGHNYSPEHVETIRRNADLNRRWAEQEIGVD